MHRKHAIRAAVAVLALVALAACTGQPKAQQQETERQQSSYNKLTSKQPAHEMTYSPTRATVNFWVDTWSKPNKLSYVYLQNAQGDLIGYYVLKGLPVSYCAALTPTYRLVRDQGSDPLVVPAPSIDGAYYSGGQCNSYYGRDASTGAYVEYTAGLGINVLLYDQPLPNHPNVEPLGRTEIGTDGKVHRR